MVRELTEDERAMLEEFRRALARIPRQAARDLFNRHIDKFVDDVMAMPPSDEARWLQEEVLKLLAAIPKEEDDA